MKTRKNEAVEAMEEYVLDKKWGYNKPNYKIVGDTFFVSKWAMGQVIGTKGRIIKAIKKIGFIKVKAMPYEEDSQYVFIKKLFRCNTKTRKVEEHNAWFRVGLNKAFSGGMYTEYVSEKTGESFPETDFNTIPELCNELEKLGEVESPIMDYDTDTNIEGLYLCEQRGMANIYCLKENLHLLKFFGYSKSDFKKYDKVALTKEKIEEFLEHIEGGDFYTAPANNLFYWLKKDGMKLNRPYTDEELVDATRTWMQTNGSEAENKVFESKIQKREEKAKLLKQEHEKLLVEFEKLNKERVEIGLKKLVLSSSEEFTLPGCSWREYKVTSTTLKLIRDDIAKKKKEEGFNNPFADFFGG